MFRVSLRIGAIASIFLAFAGLAGIADAAHTTNGASISKMCGTATMSIKCNAIGEACNSTVLTLISGDGKRLSPAKPKGIEKYSAVGLACTKASNGTQYFVVQYGEMPHSCTICEWYSVYDLQGMPMTSNDPATLTAPDLPPSQQVYPNNNEYSALEKKLGLVKAKLQYLH